jgi:HEAT repeat protein
MLLTYPPIFSERMGKMSFLQSKPPDIEKLKNERDVKKLSAALKYKEKYIRFQAIKALGELKDPRALEPLLSALKDSDSSFRESAVRALGKLGDVGAAIPLAAALKDSEMNVRKIAARVLGELKDVRAVEPLLSSLADSEREVRWTAIWALGDIQDARAVEPLISALKDSDGQIRHSAASVLGRFQDTRASEPLYTAFKEGTASALWSLADLKDARAIEPLIAALKDDKPDTRRTAIEALDKLGWKPDQGEAGATYLAVKKEKKCHNFSCRTILKGAGYHCFKCEGFFCENCIKLLGERVARFSLERLQGGDKIQAFGVVKIVDDAGRAFCPTCAGGILDAAEWSFKENRLHKEATLTNLMPTCTWLEW